MQPECYLCDTLAGLMQRLLDDVRNDYRWYVSGVIPAAKFPRLVEKFEARYGIDLDKDRRYRARHAGRVVCRLRARQVERPEGPLIEWFLLATDGSGAFHEQEKQRRRLYARRGESREVHRLQTAGFELVRLSRAHREGGGVTWTWRMGHQKYRRFEVALLRACRTPGGRGGHSPGQAQALLAHLAGLPAFRGVRHQVFALVRLANREWRRRHGRHGPGAFRIEMPPIQRVPCRSG